MMDYAAKKVDELVAIAVEKLGLSKTKARALKKDGLVSALTEAELAELPVSEHPLQMLAAPFPKKEEIIVEFVGIGGQTFSVRRDPNGIVWCDCPAWVHSSKSPRTCSHLHVLSDPINDYDVVLPLEYSMTEAELEQESELVRLNKLSVSSHAPRQRVQRSTSDLSVVFAALRKLRVCCAQNLVDLESNVTWARDRGFRALVCTLKGKDHVNRVYYVAIAEDITSETVFDELSKQLDSAQIKYDLGEGDWLELLA